MGRYSAVSVHSDRHLPAAPAGITSDMMDKEPEKALKAATINPHQVDYPPQAVWFMFSQTGLRQACVLQERGSGQTQRDTVRLLQELRPCFKCARVSTPSAHELVTEHNNRSVFSPVWERLCRSGAETVFGFSVFGSLFPPQSPPPRPTPSEWAGNEFCTFCTFQVLSCAICTVFPTRLEVLAAAVLVPGGSPGLYACARQA